MKFDRQGFDKEVGLRLQLHRKRRELTQEQLATQIGIHRASYANVEGGRQRIPIDIVWRAAIVLGVSISALVPESLPQIAPPSWLTMPQVEQTLSLTQDAVNSTAFPFLIPKLTKIPKA
jgi:transcriptional regulator with XRE-family HTH domain